MTLYQVSQGLSVGREGWVKGMVPVVILGEDMMSKSEEGRGQCDCVLRKRELRDMRLVCGQSQATLVTTPMSKVIEQ